MREKREREEIEPAEQMRFAWQHKLVIPGLLAGSQGQFGFPCGNVPVLHCSRFLYKNNIITFRKVNPTRKVSGEWGKSGVPERT